MNSLGDHREKIWSLFMTGQHICTHSPLGWASVIVLALKTVIIWLCWLSLLLFFFFPGAGLLGEWTEIQQRNRWTRPEMVAHKHSSVLQKRWKLNWASSIFLRSLISYFLFIISYFLSSLHPFSYFLFITWWLLAGRPSRPLGAQAGTSGLLKVRPSKNIAFFGK